MIESTGCIVLISTISLSTNKTCTENHYTSFYSIDENFSSSVTLRYGGWSSYTFNALNGAVRFLRMTEIAHYQLTIHLPQSWPLLQEVKRIWRLPSALKMYIHLEDDGTKLSCGTDILTNMVHSFLRTLTLCNFLISIITFFRRKCF